MNPIKKLEELIHALFDFFYNPYEALLKKMFGEDSELYIIFLIAPWPGSFALCFVLYIVISEIISK